MNLFAAFLLAASCLIFVMASCLYFHERGYRRGKAESNYEKGFREGYAEGHAIGTDWWLTAEEGIDQARQKIWKEEG